MSIESESDPSALEDLSALTDGELDSTACMRACAAWRDDVAARDTWHVYQLIGDVLRSDDLASTRGHDAGFLTALHARLANEPSVLAPEPLLHVGTPAGAAPVRRTVNAGRSSRWSWMAPSAVAAGFVLVAGALVVTRAPLPGGGAFESALARIGVGGTTPQVVSTPTLAASETSLEQPAVVINGRMLRDAKLESYLKAHQQFAGTTVLGVPSGFLRNAAAEVPNR
jgi:sigma-E factor negative regulatory protein RseA